MYTESCYQRRSILVRTAVLEEGPKNPLKGTTVKPLVLASYAQFGVGAGGRRAKRTPAAVGRSPMAWGTRPCFRGDLLLCTGVLPLWSSDLCTKQMNKPAMRCYLPLLRHERCVQSSLPCVGMVDRGADALSPRPGMM